MRGPAVRDAEAAAFIRKRRFRPVHTAPPELIGAPATALTRSEV